jgi:hypothetical protein
LLVARARSPTVGARSGSISRRDLVAILSAARCRTVSIVRVRELADRSISTRVGTVREEPVVIMSMSTSQTPELEQDLRPRARTLSWMASLSVAAGEMRAAEGYLLELLAWCAFADRTVIDVAGDNEGPHQA